MLDRYQHRLAEVDLGHGQDAHKDDVTFYRQIIELAEGAVHAERRVIIRLRDEGRISDDVLRTMQRELDLEESRYQAARL